jgi:HNH endonuclease
MKFIGYIPKAMGRRLPAQARNRCGYCLSSQKYILGVLEIEHVDPEALGGTDEEENLWLARRLCN